MGASLLALAKSIYYGDEAESVLVVNTKWQNISLTSCGRNWLTIG